MTVLTKGEDATYLREHRTRRAIVFDIETVEDEPFTTQKDFLEAALEECKAPANWKDPIKIAAEETRQFTELRRKWALSPLTGKIVAIAAADLHEGSIECWAADTETLVIAEFAGWLSAHCSSGILTGFNVRHFDVPFLATRAALHKLWLPRWWPHAKDYRALADARDLLAEGSLDVWLQRFDLPPKTADGSDVANMSLEEVREYCRNDVHVERLLVQQLARYLPLLRDAKETIP